MSAFFKSVAGLVALLAVQALPGAAHGAAASAHAHSRYAIINSVPGPDGMWNQAAVDPGHRRLYVTQGDHIAVLPLGEPAAWATFTNADALWHTVLPVPLRNLVLASDGHAHGLAVFDEKTRELHATISTLPASAEPAAASAGRGPGLADPNALVLEPKTGLIAAIDSGAGDVVFVDVERRAVVGRVAVGGKLESAVADGHGKLYVTVQSGHELAVIDVPSFKVTARIALPGCRDPRGLGYDETGNLLISACANGVAKFIDAASGRGVADLKIGRGADAVMVDGVRHRVFIAAGEDARLDVFDIEDVHHIASLQRLATERGVRVGAVDVRTGLVYLPSAKLGPPVSPHPWPTALPGTFHVMVVGAAGETGSETR